MTAIYDLTRRDYDSRYADCSRIGSYRRNPNCPKCGTQRWKRTRPLVIEWEEGADVIADFTFPGSEEIMVTNRVREFLEGSGLRGFEFGPVSMEQNRKLKKPRRPNPRKKRVWLPYEGPLLWELWTTSLCRLNLDKSKRTLLSECPVCHWREYVVDEETPLENSFFVEARSWDGSDFFRIQDLDLTFVTEKAARALAKQEFTNLLIEKRGKIVGDTRFNMLAKS